MSGDEEPAAATAEAPVSPRPVPPETGAVTPEEIAAWCGMTSSVERMASVARRFSCMGYDDDVLRDFYQWNLQFIQDAGMGPEKGAVVFQLLKEQRDDSVGQGLSLTDSLAGFQGRLLEASKQPPAPAPAEAEAPAAETAAEDGEEAAEGAEGAEAGEAKAPPPAAAATPAPPTALAVTEVKVVADYFLKTFYRHYELHQAVFGATSGEAVRKNRVPSEVCPRTRALRVAALISPRLASRLVTHAPVSSGS